MPINPPLQARAGRNSPDQTFFPVFRALLNVLKKLTAAVAPGVDIKIAEGGDGILFFQGVRAFIGANAGLAELLLTGTLRRDSDGAVFATDAQTLGPGANTSVSFTLGNGVLPKGFSLWVNVTLVGAGVYGGDASIQSDLSATQFSNEGPKDLSTTLETVVDVDEGHSLLLTNLQVYNRDTIAHDVEVYLGGPLGDVLVDVQSVGAGLSANFYNFGGLNSDETLKARIPVAVATAGRSVTVFGAVVESNLLNA